MALAFIDIVVARVLLDNKDHPPKQRQLLIPRTNDGLVNNYLTAHAIPSSYAPAITSNQKLTESIQHLRDVGLVQQAGTYVPTSGMEAFFERLGLDWRTWPIVLPYSDDGAIRWEEAEYRKTARGYRRKKGHT